MKTYRPLLVLGSLIALVVSCSKPPEKKPEMAPPVTAPAVSVAVVAPASASASGKHRHEDRHEAAQDSGTSLTLDVKIAGVTKSWQRSAFDKVPKVTIGGVGNDGENRETWSLRELAHTLVGPNARVVAIVGPEETRTLDRAAWDDAARTPILHTTRRGTLKFRWADKAGKWGDAEVKDVSRLEIEP